MKEKICLRTRDQIKINHCATTVCDRRTSRFNGPALQHQPNRKGNISSTIASLICKKPAHSNKAGSGEELQSSNWLIRLDCRGFRSESRHSIVLKYSNKDVPAKLTVLVGLHPGIYEASILIRRCIAISYRQAERVLDKMRNRSYASNLPYLWHPPIRSTSVVFPSRTLRCPGKDRRANPTSPRQVDRLIAASMKERNRPREATLAQWRTIGVRKPSRPPLTESQLKRITQTVIFGDRPRGVRRPCSTPTSGHLQTSGYNVRFTLAAYLAHISLAFASDRTQFRRMTGARILLVDDEILIRELLAEVLRDAGFDVVEARNADEAMRSCPAMRGSIFS